MDRTVRIPIEVITALVVALSVFPLALRTASADVHPGQEPSSRDSVFRQASELTPAMVEAEIERRFNDLRADVLATQASALQWWMRMVAIALTFFGIAVPVFGFLGFNRFREIERDARHSAAAVTQAAESTKRYLAEVETVRSNLLAGDDEEVSVPVVAGALSHARAGKRLLSQPHDATDPMACLTRGAANADIGKHEEAIAEYDQAIRLSGGIDGVAYHNRGASCLSLGRYEEAIADYAAAIRLDPMDAAAYAMRGFAKAEVGRTEEAIADYSESIRLQPDDGGTWLARGIVKREAGMRDEARDDLESALTLAKAAGDGPLAARVEKLLHGWRVRPGL